MNRTLLALVLTLSLPALGMAGEPSIESEKAPPVEILVADALKSNPQVEASEAQWRMFVQKARQAGTLADPMIMLGLNNVPVADPFTFDQDPMTSKSVGISQELPFWGKRALAREAADLEARSYESRYGERKLELAQMVKETYYRLFFIDQALDVVGRNLRIMQDVIRFAEARYGTGQGIQQDVLKAQVERSRMLDMQISLRQQRRSLEAALNNLLFRPASTEVGPIPTPEVVPLHLSVDELHKLALENRPLLEGLNALVEKGKTEEKLARKEYYPDFTVSLEYMQREPAAMGGEGEDMYNAAVTFNLPLQRQRRRAMVAEAEAQTRMARAELEDLRNAIDTGIADLTAQLEKGAKLIELYRGGIIPQAARSFESARIAYQNNQIDFPALLESLQTQFNYEQEYYDALADYRMNLARLEALVGRDLPVQEEKK